MQHGDAVAERHADGVVVGVRPKKITPTEVVDSTRTNGVVEDGADGVGRFVEVVPCDGGNQAVPAGIVIDRHGSLGGVAVVVALGGGADGVVDIGVRPLEHRHLILLSTVPAAPGRELALVGRVVARRIDILPAPGEGQGSLAVHDGKTHPPHIPVTLGREVEDGNAVVERPVDGVVEGATTYYGFIGPVVGRADAHGVVDVHHHGAAILLQVGGGDTSHSAVGRHTPAGDQYL